MSTELLIDQAMKKFPKAKRLAVVNFTGGYTELSLEAAMNLELDTQMYRWNSHTVAAISYVLRHKHAFSTLAD